MNPVFPDPTELEQDFDALSIDFVEVEVPELPPLEDLEVWLKSIVVVHNCEWQFLQYVFCSDTYLHEMNVQYLNHDTLTDIITFPFEEPPLVNGEMYISIDRVRDNALSFGVSAQHELLRVMAHGVLHLCGFGDKSDDEALKMRKLEDEALALWK